MEPEWIETSVQSRQHPRMRRADDLSSIPDRGRISGSILIQKTFLR